MPGLVLFNPLCGKEGILGTGRKENQIKMEVGNHSHEQSAVAAAESCSEHGHAHAHEHEHAHAHEHGHDHAGCDHASHHDSEGCTDPTHDHSHGGHGHVPKGYSELEKRNAAARDASAEAAQGSGAATEAAPAPAFKLNFCVAHSAMFTTEVCPQCEAATAAQ